MKYAACLFMALPLAAATIQPGVSIMESNCNPGYCIADGSFNGFGTDVFSASEIAQGDNQDGSAYATVTIDVTGTTLGPLESGFIVFSYPACNGITEVGCNGVLGAGGFASAYFDIGSVEGGPPDEVGQPRPYAGTLVPFEVGEPFGITITSEFDAPSGSLANSGSAEVNFSFQIFDSQTTPLIIYDLTNNAVATPEPATWLLILFGLLAIGCNLRRNKTV